MAALKMLLDVGSRNGESLEEFVRWDFDVIHAFEPMPAPFANIVAAFGDHPRVVAHNFGLSNVTGTLPVYGADHMGEASVFPTKWDVDSRTVTDCEFVDATEFFREHVTEGVFVKLNCEGSEIAILNNLLDSGELWKAAAVRVEFDISRVPDHAHEADLLLARLDEAGFDRLTIGSDARIVNGGLVDRVPQEGTHHGRLAAWLTAAGA